MADFTRLFISDEYFLKAHHTLRIILMVKFTHQIHLKFLKFMLKFNFIPPSKAPSDSVVNELNFLVYLFENNQKGEAFEFIENELERIYQ
ncbi:MAG: hypothetical protein MR902_06460 [Campylobacter sp.]|nr:hypothetical protein [Campylobacter sp.]